MVLAKYPDGHDDDEKKTSEKTKRRNTQIYLWKGNINSSGCLE